VKTEMNLQAVRSGESVRQLDDYLLLKWCAPWS